MTTCLTRRVPAAAPGPSALSRPATPERSAEEEQQGQASKGELDLELSGAPATLQSKRSEAKTAAHLHCVTRNSAAIVFHRECLLAVLQRRSDANAKL